MRDRFGRFIKGWHHSVKTEFKVGQFSGERHPKWKGGRVKLTNGYIQVHTPGHPRAYRNLVYEHVLVMEKKLGRYLTERERCHHINGIKDDNRVENLTVCVTNAEHMSKYHATDKWARKFDACVRCGKSDTSHVGNGVCQRCVNQDNYAKRKAGT